MIGAVWVYRDASLSTAPTTAQAQRAQQYPARAVNALSKLDDGNRLIDRCRYYLEQFNKILVDPGKLLLFHWESEGLTLPETDDPIPTFSPMPSNRGSFPAGNFGLSPFGMELGDFMMDDDLVAMIDRQEFWSTDPRSTYPA
jgi:hypothetical protein